MRHVMRGLPFIVLLLVLIIPSFAATGPEPGIAKGDHQALAMYYAEQEQDFKAKARFWDNAAESYEHHPELYKSSDITNEAAHCRQIAGNYRKMAERPRPWRAST
ncbi:MAG: hypothetical protein A4E19_00475 [Nitrospira sp. SG-bin1]|nr:MAG: hypothetical protein A4E19_00475 [Nitrospira sp. SG-bin1]